MLSSYDDCSQIGSRMELNKTFDNRSKLPETNIKIHDPFVTIPFSKPDAT